MKTIKYIFNCVYTFFYNKLGSDKYTSTSASISILIILAIVVTLIIINLISNYFFKLNLIKEMNQWVLLLIITGLYLFYRFFLLKMIKK